MGLLLDPAQTVEHRIEDVTFHLRVFTGRQFAGFVSHVQPLQKAMGDGTEVDLTPELVDHLEYVIRMGIAWFSDGSEAANAEGGMLSGEQLDLIPFRVWSELYSKILEVNFVGEDDAKN